MKTFLQVAALTAVLIVPFSGAQAQQQGSNEAPGYAQSHGHAGGYGGAYASAGRHHRHWR